MEKVTGGLKKLLNEDLHYFCSSFNAICVYYMKEYEREKRVAHRRGRNIHIAFWFGILKEGEHLEDIEADGIVILKLICKKEYWRV
jgi:hypothetical protein